VSIALPEGFRSRWVNALRSGQYQKTVRALRRDAPEGPRFCALGVACDLLDPEGWAPIARFPHVFSWNARAVGAITVSGFAWGDFALGITDFSLMRHRNDRQGWSFEQMADWIDGS
jgi:hypothetical protein